MSQNIRESEERAVLWNKNAEANDQGITSGPRPRVSCARENRQSLTDFLPDNRVPASKRPRFRLARLCSLRLLSTDTRIGGFDHHENK